MAVHAYGNREPRIDPSAFVAPGARIVGDVELGPRASVWFNAVVRGDSDAVRIGAETNVQDGAVLHTDEGSPCLISSGCTIGHNAVVHGCRVADGCLIGMGSAVLSGASIGPDSLVAAGALVPPGATFPPRSLIVGSPARLKRELTEEDVESLIRPGVEHYPDFAKTYRALHGTD